jgi:hypothetical protein
MLREVATLKGFSGKWYNSPDASTYIRINSQKRTQYIFHTSIFMKGVRSM